MEEFELPGPPNANYPTAGGQITAFVGDDEWLLACQVLVYSRREASFEVVVHAFGDKVKEPGLQFSRVVVCCAGGEDCWDDDGAFRLNLYDFSVEIQEEVTHHRFSLQDYMDAGIDPNNMEPELALIRMLAHRMLDDLLFTPADILVELKKSHLRQILTLRAWRQPDVTEDEKPSDLTCFQKIAQSIAEGRAVELDACT
ncbi:MAG: hypothetical protein LC775_12505, partial [Acidobacteria bacterium]|nr:hypothetical protein [Acidobacteriota bacterium]